jgi:NAD(P)-dependent dehydrogenase (short-subunit alcohol dehydrogenase family)
MAREGLILRPLRGFFRGRKMLVTGASSGIGRDIALLLAGLGVQSALLARREALLEDLASEIRVQGGDALVLTADVSRSDQVREAVARALDQFGHIDILVNCAGVLERGLVETMDPHSLQRMVDVNVLGTLHAIQAVLPAMRRGGSGNIVNIGSLAGRRGIPPLGGYSATKFALVGLTEALRVELFGSGVRVSLVMPGVVETAMLRGKEAAGHITGWPEMIPAMPVRWVTWAVIAALTLGLTEVDVPPGAAVAEKLAALFPGITDGALALGSRVWEWAARRSHPTERRGNVANGEAKSDD